MSWAWWERCFFGESTQLQKSKSRKDIKMSSWRWDRHFSAGPGLPWVRSYPPEQCRKLHMSGEQERFHEAQNSYQCEKCPKIFRYFSWLKVHEGRHNNKRTYIGAACNKGFFQASGLHTHQKIQAGEKPFWCSVCTKSISHRTNLLAHEHIHMGEKPMCVQSARDATTSHSPTITPWGYTRELPSDMFPPHQKPPWCNANKYVMLGTLP